MKLLFTLCFIFIYSMQNCNGSVCSGETYSGSTIHISCPRITDDSDKIFCCGTDRDIQCCSTPLGLNEEDLEFLADKMPAIIGTIAAIIMGLIIMCIVCCCCCPFCLLHKRRSHGTVHQPNATMIQVPTSNYAPVTQHSQGNQPPPAAGYAPPPAAGYAPPPATGYAPPPATGYAPPPATGYAPPPQPQGYGMPPQTSPYPVNQQSPYPLSNEQPPAYSAEKQLPFNPTY